MHKNLKKYFRSSYKDLSIHNLVSDKFPVNRGGRQGDPVSFKLHKAVLEETFQTEDISEGINLDGKHLTNLRFTNAGALFKGKNWKYKHSKFRLSHSWPKNTQRKGKIYDKLALSFISE